MDQRIGASDCQRESVESVSLSDLERRLDKFFAVCDRSKFVETALCPQHAELQVNSISRVPKNRPRRGPG